MWPTTALLEFAGETNFLWVGTICLKTLRATNKIASQGLTSWRTNINLESCLPNQSVFALPGVVQYHDSCVPSPCKYILSFKRMLLKNNRKNKPPWGRTVSTALGISKAAHPPKKKKTSTSKESWKIPRIKHWPQLLPNWAPQRSGKILGFRPPKVPSSKASRILPQRAAKVWRVCRTWRINPDLVS